MSLTKLDFDKICRTCLEHKDNMISIFDPEVLKMFNSCTTIKIDNNDLPRNLCSTCLTKINAAYCFNQQCENSNLTLHQILNETTDDDKSWFKSETVEVNDNHIFMKTELSQVPKTETNTQLSSTSTDSSFLSDHQLLASLIEPPESRSVSKISKTCRICSRVFSRINSYTRHINWHHKNGDMKVFCDICKKGFTDNKYLVDHARKCNEKGSFVCDDCGKDFNKIAELDFHIRTNHHNFFTCTRCHQIFALQETLDLHRKIHNNTSSLLHHTCTECNKTFEHAYKLRKHQIIHRKNKPFHCLDCNKDFKYSDSYRLHRRRKHSNEKKSRCDICDKEVLHLKAHNLRKHTTEKPFKCTDCHLTFATELLLRCHKKITHEKLYSTKKALCNVCGLKCLNNNALVTHMRVHSEEKPFQCDLCDKAFKSRNGFIAHQSSHKDDRPYTCDVCKKGFKQRKTLKRHMIVHTGERPYVCHICDKSFNQNSILRTHMKVHSSDL